MSCLALSRGLWCEGLARFCSQATSGSLSVRSSALLRVKYCSDLGVASSDLLLLPWMWGVLQTRATGGWARHSVMVAVV